jgi:hypothetical protein
MSGACKGIGLERRVLDIGGIPVTFPACGVEDPVVDWSWLVGNYHDEIVQPGKQPLLLLFVGLIGGFGFIRTSTRMIRAQVRWWPGNVSAGGIHLHHEVFGVLLMMVSGAATFAISTVHPWRDILALTFGIGAGLVLDEFALLLRLKDVYWTKEGRTSIDAVIVAVLVIAMLLVHAVPFGVDDLKPGEASARWLAVSIVSVNLFLTLVTALKGKPWLALFSTIITIIGVFGALRLATPQSPWAKRWYDADKCAAAARRAAPWVRRKQRLISLIGGSPTPVAASASAGVQAATVAQPGSPQ